MSLIDQTIHGYKIQVEIGKGGFGVVYVAWQETVNRTVAIKVILPEYANQPEFQQQFETEARLIANLEHPHIIPLYDYWQDETGAYLVMRYIPEGTLEELLLKEETLSWTVARRIILQLVEALEVAHDNGIIHRDIKPANILLDDRGNAYLSDFGVAWMSKKASEDITIAGTIAYLSPELFEGKPPSPQSDLYALGILFYQMLAGIQPFTGSVTDVIDSHMNVSIPSISDIRSDLPDTIETILLRLTMKDPDSRYPSASALLAELNDSLVLPQQSPKAKVSMVSTRQGLQQSSSKQGNSLKLRNRFSMIDTVYSYWIDGVLENLLSGYALLDLHLQLEPKYVSTSNPLEDEATESIAESAESILQIFEAYNGKLLILGEAGTGKSTLLLTLARELLYQANEDEDFPIPVIFNLSSWHDETSLGEWMKQELNEKYQVPRSVANRWVENDSLLLLLDGLDEVDEQYRKACLDAINTWRNEHSFVDIVVSSRIVDYDALEDPLQLNGSIVIQPLADEQVNQYLDSIHIGSYGLRSLLDRNSELRELSRSPLMLAVMLTAYKEETIESLPDFSSLDEQRDYLFELYVQRAWQRRRTEKKFSLDEIRTWFSHLAFAIHEHSQALFFIEDLQADWLPEKEQKKFHNLYRFLIPLILSATWCLSSVLFLDSDEYLYYAVFGALWGWTLFFSIERFGFARSLLLFVVLVGVSRVTLDSNETLVDYLQKSQFRSTLPYTLIVGMLAVLYRRTGQMSQIIHSVDALNFSFASTKWQGAAAGLVSGFLVTIPNILLTGDISALEIIIKMAGTTFFAWIVTGFRSNQVPLSAQLNEKIHRSFRNGLKMGLVGGITVMILVGIAFYPKGFDLSDEAPALFNFLPLAVTTFLVFGGAATLQHYLLRRQLVNKKIISAQLIELLDEGVQLGIMRRVGGGVIFIHRYLLEYFANLQKDNIKLN